MLTVRLAKEMVDTCTIRGGNKPLMRQKRKVRADAARFLPGVDEESRLNSEAGTISALQTRKTRTLLEPCIPILWLEQYLFAVRVGQLEFNGPLA